AVVAGLFFSRRRALEQRLETVEIVYDAPSAAFLLDAMLPFVETGHVLAWIDVVATQLRDVQRDDFEAVDGHLDVAYVAGLEIFLEVREDEDRLAARLLLVQELDGLQQPARDVRVRRGGRLVEKPVDGLRELALLLIRRARPIVERHLRHDVLLAEAARVDTRDGERVERVEPRERVVDDLLGLVELLAVRPGGVEQQIDAGVVRGRRTARRDSKCRDAGRRRRHRSPQYPVHDATSALLLPTTGRLGPRHRCSMNSGMKIGIS